MKVFLIVLAVLVVIFALILSLSAELTVIYENGWHTTVKVLFFEKDIELSEILAFILFPEETAKNVADNKKKEKQQKEEQKAKETAETKKVENKAEKAEPKQENSAEPPKKVEENKPANTKKSNPISKMVDEDGVLGIMLFVSNLLQTAGTALSTLIKGLHIYSLYVKMIIGSSDAADTGRFFGLVTGYYYPIKGMILNGLKVDQYDDYITADFIAPRSEYELQFIGSINVGLLLKVVLRAGKKFVINLIKNK